jgi:glycosyltransferase involved in cell wall biosynthesis
MSAPVRTALHVFSTFAVGGPQIRFAAIANHLGRAWRHLILAMDADTACAARLDAGLDVSFPDIPVRKGHLLANRAAFRAALASLRPDVLVTSNWGSIEWALANFPTRVRHVHMEDGFGPEEQSRQIPRRVWTRRIALRRAEILVPSRNLERIARELWRLPERRVHYVPNGIDLPRFAAPRGSAAAIPLIGTVAALRPEKNVARLIDAFALLRARRPARLVIVGDGPERPALESLAARHGIAAEVTFAGQDPAPERHYAAFDVFALASDTEQMPLSVLEAMASSLPVVATDVGDIRAMVSVNNTPYIAPRDAAALADALDRLLATPGTMRAIGAANRARAEAEFDERRMFATHEAFWRGDVA